MSKRMLLALVFCVSFFGVAQAQPGAVQKKAIDTAIQAVRDEFQKWDFKQVEIGVDSRGPEIKAVFGRNDQKSDTVCTPASEGPNRGATGGQRPSDRQPRESSPRDRQPRESQPRESQPRESGRRDSQPADRERAPGGKRDIN